MKRSQTLIQLSREHHTALVLAKRAQTNALDSGTLMQLMADFPARWNEELEPHFTEEEQVLLPRLLSEGADALAGRLAEDHAGLRALSARIIGGDATALPEFGRLLADHVRFEERELFPHYEQLIGAHSQS